MGPHLHTVQAVSHVQNSNHDTFEASSNAKTCARQPCRRVTCFLAQEAHHHVFCREQWAAGDVLAAANGTPLIMDAKSRATAGSTGYHTCRRLTDLGEAPWRRG